MRIEEVANEGLKSAVLSSLKAPHRELSVSIDDFMILKKVPPLKGLEIESVNKCIVNISNRSHIRYWTGIIERNANVTVANCLVAALETCPNYLSSLQHLQDVLDELRIDVQLAAANYKQDFPQVIYNALLEQCGSLFRKRKFNLLV